MRAPRLVVITGVLAVLASGCAAEPADMDADLSHLADREDAAEEDSSVEASPTEGESTESDSTDAGPAGGQDRITDGPTGVSFTLVGADEPVETDPEIPGRGAITMRIWRTESDAREAGVNVIELDTPAFDLDASLEGSARAMGATLVNPERVTVDGYDGRWGDIEFPDDSTIARWAVAQADTTVIQVFTIDRDGLEEEEIDAEFVALLESVDIP